MGFESVTDLEHGVAYVDNGSVPGEFYRVGDKLLVVEWPEEGANPHIWFSRTPGGWLRDLRVKGTEPEPEPELVPLTADDLTDGEIMRGYSKDGRPVGYYLRLSELPGVVLYTAIHHRHGWVKTGRGLHSTVVRLEPVD